MVRKPLAASVLVAADIFDTTKRITVRVGAPFDAGPTACYYIDEIRVGHY